MVHKTISVALQQNPYPVYVGSDLLGDLGDYARTHRLPDFVTILADRNSARVALSKAKTSLARAGYRVLPIVIPPGEHQKNPRRVEAIQATMLAHRVPRNSALIALGGGVVGDIAGFVASTYRRGLLFVQCPTTLLSQVDSSVGGKNGVNYPKSKNAVGTYLQPVFVLSDVGLLSFLTRREMVSGLGEILKYPLVADPDLLSYIEKHLERILACERDTILEVASRCLHIKAGLVAEDEREMMPDRGRVLLNVGHAIGHALESLSRYRLRHGEAVLLGILAECHIAVGRGFSRESLGRFVAVYRAIQKKLSLRGITSGAVVRSVLGNGQTRVVLPSQLGTVAVVHDVTAGEVRAAFKFISSL